VNSIQHNRGNDEIDALIEKMGEDDFQAKNTDNAYSNINCNENDFNVLNKEIPEQSNYQNVNDQYNNAIIDHLHVNTPDEFTFHEMSFNSNSQ